MQLLRYRQGALQDGYLGVAIPTLPEQTSTCSIHDQRIFGWRQVKLR